MISHEGNLEELRSVIDQEVALHQANGALLLDAFAEVIVTYLYRGEVVPDLNIRALSSPGPYGKKMELLGYGFDEADESLNILVGAYSKTGEQTLQKSEIAKIIEAGKAFVEAAISGWIESNLEPSSYEAEDAYAIADFSKKAKSYRFRLISNKVMSERIKTIPNQEIGGLPASFDIWDLKRTQELISSATGREDFTIDFTQWLPNGLLALVGDSGSTLTGDTYLATIPGHVLADIFDTYGSQLLEQNVRTFLSTRGKINKGIQKTLSDEPELFLAYNNGITSTATAMEIEVDDEGKHHEDFVRIHSLTNLQIVNGGQTTSSLSYFRRNSKDKSAVERSLRNVKVQMKLVLVNEENLEAETLVSAVSRYANSQNPVNEADLASNAKYHIALENLSRSVPAPAEEGKQYQSYWYYERARGQWENQKAALTPSKRKSFDLKYPKNQRIDKTSWAKYQLSWEQKPHTVSKGAQANFMEFQKQMYANMAENPSFVDEDYFKSGVAKAILFQETRNAVMQADWYETGYLANIVTYAVAKLAYEIEQQFSDKNLNFKKIWVNQGISDSLSDLLANLGYIVREVLIDPTKTQKNVSQYAKTELCWDKVKEAFALIPPLGDDLIDIDSQFIIGEPQLDVITRVMNVDSAVYRQVLQTLNGRGLIAQEQITLALQTVLHPRVAIEPNEEEALKILDLLDLAKSHGIIDVNSY